MISHPLTVPIFFFSQLLEHAKEQRSLMEVAVNEGFNVRRGGMGTVFIGLDGRYNLFLFQFRISILI
jgi:hypothetical protein